MVRAFWYVVLVSLIFQTTTVGQKTIDLVNIGYTHYGAAASQDFDYELSQASYWAAVNVPFELPKADLVAHASYSGTQLDNTAYEDDALNFQAVQLGFSYVRNLKNPNWAWSADVSAAVASNFTTFKSDHLNYNTNLLFYYGKNEELVWNFGVDYTVGSFGDLLVPMIGVDWQVTDALRLSFQSFSHLDVAYQLRENLTAGIRLESVAYSFNLPNYFGIEESTVYSYAEELPYMPQELTVYADVHITPQLATFGRVGTSFARSVLHSDFEGELLEDSAYNTDLDPSLLLEFGMAWRIVGE